MKELNLIKRGKLEWVEKKEPKIESPKSAIVKPIFMGRCDLDYYMILGATPFSLPIPIGHEFIGVITEVGEEVNKLQKGQKVLVPFHISCGNCNRCKKKIFAFCESTIHGATFGLGEFGGNYGGGLSDLVYIPYAESMLIPIPEDINPLDVYAAADNLSDAWRTVGPYLEENYNQSVLILGSGSVGLYSALIAKALNSPKIDYIDNNLERLELAKRIGINAFEEIPENQKYDITIDASASEKKLVKAIFATEPGGICTSTGIYFSNEVKLPLWDMYNKDITFKTGRVHSGAKAEKIFSLVKEKKIEPSILNTKIINWSDAKEGYKEKAIKLVVVRDDGDN